MIAGEIKAQAEDQDYYTGVNLAELNQQLAQANSDKRIWEQHLTKLQETGGKQADQRVSIKNIASANERIIALTNQIQSLSKQQTARIEAEAKKAASDPKVIAARQAKELEISKQKTKGNTKLLIIAGIVILVIIVAIFLFRRRAKARGKK